MVGHFSAHDFSVFIVCSSINDVGGLAQQRDVER
jgi:hypothetical protein